MAFRGGIRAGLASVVMSCATLSAFAPPASAADPGARILYFESLPRLALAASSSGSQKTTQRQLQFDAYGRRFELSLQENSRLSALVQQSKTGSAPPLQLYRGSLDGVPGSWVRLAARGDDVSGMIWDGSELYAIEKASELGAALVAPLDESASDTLIFRLSDTLLEVGASFCASDEAAVPSKGADAYDSLVEELKSSITMMQAAGATRRIELSVLADAAFLQSRGTQEAARDAVLARLNNVDGIFSSQLDLEIQVPSIDISTPDNDPFSSTTSASSLLSELGKLRKESSALRSRGLTHLFTGRNLNGSTVGIAYLDSLCHAEYGAGLTEATNRGSWLEALIAAHEIGHNFGAVHDGQGSCSSTPQNVYLMSPSVSSNTSTFSQCSRNAISSRIQSASCITQLPPPDLAISSQLGTQRQAAGRSFEWELIVSNIGGSTAQNATVDILIPPAIVIEDAYVPGGTCISGAGIIFCQMGEVPGGDHRIVHLTLSSETVGSNAVSATVAAQTDAQSSNNAGSGTIVIDPESDISITLQAPASATAGASFQASYSVANLAAREATDVTVTLDVPTELTISAFSLPAASCTQQAAMVECTLPTLAAGATAAGTITLTAPNPGTSNLRARTSGSYIDPVPENDSAEQAVVIASAPATIQSATPTGSSGSSGGGGSTGFGLLVALGALYRWKKRLDD